MNKNIMSTVGQYIKNRLPATADSLFFTHYFFNALFL
jgi:hypothetical protein